MSVLPVCSACLGTPHASDKDDDDERESRQWKSRQKEPREGGSGVPEPFRRKSPTPWRGRRRHASRSLGLWGPEKFTYVPLMPSAVVRPAKPVDQVEKSGDDARASQAKPRRATPRHATPCHAGFGKTRCRWCRYGVDMVPASLSSGLGRARPG